MRLNLIPILVIFIICIIGYSIYGLFFDNPFVNGRHH